MEKSQKRFYIFLFLNLVLWSIVPLLRQSLPMDTQEALVWGHYYLFGTPKHPPFSGYLAYPFYILLGKSHFSMYLLSQICVLLGIIYIYRLAKKFLNPQKAILASMLQFGIIYYNFSSVEYNVNVVSLALWPMCAFYFWQAYRFNKYSDWILFSLTVAANLLNKYTAATLLFAIALFVLYDKNARKLIYNPRAYLAIFPALLLVLPHIIWLFQTDFISFSYIAGRTHNGKLAYTWLGHIIYPLKFIFAQILFSALSVLTFFYFYKKSDKERSVKDTSQTDFLKFVFFVPIAVFLLIAVFSGQPLKSMWGFPLLFLLGINLFYFFDFKISKPNAVKMFFVMCCGSFLFAFAYTWQCLLTTSEKFQLNNEALVDRLTQIWQQNMGATPLKYVGANEWYADMVSLYSADTKPIFWMDFSRNPDLNVANVYNSSALVLSNSLDEYLQFAQNANANLSQAQKITIEFHNYFGKNKQKELYYGFYNQQRHEK